MDLTPLTLWRMKQTKREQDVPDRLFLRMLLESQGHKVEPTKSTHDRQTPAREQSSVP